MTHVITFVLVASVGMLAYVYAGYPLLLRVVVRLRGPRAVRKQPITPTVSIVISAFNEADVIRDKVVNALALDYPADHFDVVVISDASDDGTDEIVTAFNDPRVRLARQPERRGKTAGLNRTLPTLTGEIVVFSDANAMYEPDALQKLVRNFADPDVGYVTGEARYVTGNRAAADVGERAYWDYEIQIKRLETALGSMVGGDGAIYAIRRSLWRTLPDDAINDFLNPLQIVAAGWRGVYEPEAVCYEDTAGAVKSEYRRRVRIVSRSWRAVFLEPRVLNPFRVGVFAWSIISHKVLRWFSGLFASAAALSAGVLAAEAVSEQLALGVGIALLGLLVVMAFRAGRRVVAMGAYFLVINLASLVGIIKGTSGRVSGVWSTPRQADGAVHVPAPQSIVVPVGRLLLVCGLLGIAAVAGACRVTATARLATVAFWGSSVLLAYVYIGYPLMLGIARSFFRHPVKRRDIQPRVCLLIAANDESSVIEAKLQNSLAVDYPADLLDIVVASDGSVDGTNDIVARFAPRVRLLATSPRRGKVAAINGAIQSVTSDIVIFSDANTFLAADAIRALVRNFADPEVGAVSGDVALVGDRAALARSEDLYYVYERWVQRAESDIGSMIGADGALYAIRRELFVPPAPDTILDDMAIPMAVVRAGRRVVFEPEARATEYGSESAREEFARKSRVIAGAIQFLRRADSAVPIYSPQVVISLLSHKGLRWMSPVFATCAFLSSVALASASHGYAAAAAAQGVLVLFGITGCIPGMRRFGVVALTHYFCLVQAAAIVGFIRGLTGQQSVLWRRFMHGAANQTVGVV